MTHLEPAHPVRSFFARRSGERGRVGEALLIVGAVRIGLSLLPFTVMKRLARPARRVARALSHASGTEEDLSSAVRVAARHVPDASCLTRAIALHLLLLRRGLDSEIRIGVAGEGARFAAHAWLERDGRVLIGGGPGSFVPLHRASGTGT